MKYIPIIPLLPLAALLGCRQLADNVSDARGNGIAEEITVAGSKSQEAVRSIARQEVAAAMDGVVTWDSIGDAAQEYWAEIALVLAAGGITGKAVGAWQRTARRRKAGNDTA